MKINPFGKSGKHTIARQRARAREDVEHKRKQHEESLTDEDIFFDSWDDKARLDNYLKNNPNISQYRRESIGQLQDRNQRRISGYVSNIRTGMEDSLMDSLGVGEHKDTIRLLTRKTPRGFKGNIKALGLRTGTRFLTNLPGMLVNAAKSQIDAAGQRQQLGEALGASDNEMQALNYASDRFNTDPDTLHSAVNNLGASRDAAISGDTQAQKAFADLGVSLADLEEKTNVDLFAQLTRQFESGNVSVEQFRAGLSLLGEEFQALQPAMENGLGKTIAEFQESSLAIDPNTSKTLAELSNGFGMLAELAGKAAGAVGSVVSMIASPVWAAVSKVLSGFVNGATFLGKMGLAMVANLAAPFSDTAKEFRDNLLDSLQEVEGDEKTVELNATLNRKQTVKAAEQARQVRLEEEKQAQQKERLAQAKELEQENLKRVRAKERADRPTESKIAEIQGIREMLTEMISREQDPLRKQELIQGKLNAIDDETALQAQLDREREGRIHEYQPPGLDQLARSGIYTSTATANYAQQLPDIQRAMLTELRMVTRAVQENTQAVQGVFGH